MARKKSSTLTDVELRLMNVLWEQGPSTVSDVQKALPKRERAAYTTVLTMLRILEEKGYLDHVQDGRAFVYRPLIGRDEAQRSSVSHLVGRLFDGSPGALVLNVLENEQLTPEELARLRELIAKAEGA
jgi:predicted transcriptional regulator